MSSCVQHSYINHKHLSVSVCLYLVSVVCSQQVGGQCLQFVLGHVLQCGQAAASHGLLQVHSRVAQAVHSGWSQLIAGVQDLHRRDAHHTAVQSSYQQQRTNTSCHIK